MLAGEAEGCGATVGAGDVEVDDGECALARGAGGAGDVIDNSDGALDAWGYESPVGDGDGGSAEGAVGDACDLDDIGVVGDVVVS